MQKTRSTKLLDVYKGLSMSILESPDTGDFVRFTHIDEDGTRLIASGYIDRINGKRARVLFNNCSFWCDLADCEILCKQFTIPGT